MTIARSLVAGATTVVLALGALVAASTASSAAIWTYVGPFGVVNETNRKKCESIRKVYIADGYRTKACYTANGQYYFSIAL